MALISSSFDSGNEGWSVFGDAQGATATPSYNAAGYIFATDDVAGGTWYWRAPAAFLGDQSLSYGLTLSFDLRQSATDSQSINDDVIIEGGGMRIALRFASFPGTAFTHYELTLGTDAGWVDKVTRQPVTADQFHAVLSAIDSVMIRGEYRFGPDTGALDNVQLQSNLTRGGAGDDTLAGDQFVAASSDALYGLGGKDSITGGGGDDRLYGGSGNDALEGSAGADRLQGDAGADLLSGGAGRDTLIGGAGRDLLAGGTANDVFRFARASDSGPGNERDEIGDFLSGDRIDLAAIDADLTLAGNQAFGGLDAGAGPNGGFTQPGQLYFDTTASILHGNNDADADADFSIHIVFGAAQTLGVADLIL